MVVMKDKCNPCDNAAHYCNDYNSWGRYNGLAYNKFSEKGRFVYGYVIFI